MSFTERVGRKSDFGWIADRIDAAEPDSLTNLRPLHWKNCADKVEGQLPCCITAVGAENVDIAK